MFEQSKQRSEDLRESHSEGYSEGQGEGRSEGIVKWYCCAKGFGFITTKDIETDVFVHYMNTPKCKKVGTRRLLEGQQVSFELRANDLNGYEALEVEIEKPFVYA